MMQSTAFPSSQELGELTAFVATTLFEKAFTSAAASPQPATPSSVGPQESCMELALNGEPTWLLRAHWTPTTMPSVMGSAAGTPEAAASLERSAIGELLNIVAGQLKSRYNLAHQLGLPQAPSERVLGKKQGQRAEAWLALDGRLHGVHIEAETTAAG